MTPRTAAAIATAAATAATAGDLLLLYVVNASRPEFAHLSPAPANALLAGYYLGSLAIPLYGLGYWAIAQTIAPAGRGRARWVCWLGVGGGVVGGIVHALTGAIIRFEQLSGRAGSDPVAVVATWGAYLVPFWILLGTMVMVGSLLYAGAVLSGRTALPRSMALVNPLVLLAATSVFATTSPTLEAFLLPAGPNLVHVVFFGAAAARMRAS